LKTKSIPLITAALIILATAVLAKVLEPRVLMARDVNARPLEEVIPARIGSWQQRGETGLVVPADPDARRPSAYLYSQEVSRVYSDGQGNTVMLMVAYGPLQSSQFKAHWPENCYTAAGFRVSRTSSARIDLRQGTTPLAVTQLTAQRESRFEPITYWMRVGNDVATGVVNRQLSRLKYGLRGIIPDGVLIRVSSLGLSSEASFKLHGQFIRDLLAAVPRDERPFFVGNLP
jgi:EpsI family protein